MALKFPGSNSAQTARTSLDPTNLTDWAEPPEEARDWKKLFLVTGLALLSWVATYVGMLELIEANMGDLPIVHKAIIGFSVAMLMVMVVWLLDQMFKPIGLFTKVCYAAGYIFLSLISIGFGFGFYWKVLESKGEGTRVAETAVGTVQAPLQTAATRLESLGKTLDSLQTISAQKAEQERTAGTSCPNSKPGDGPRRKLRDDDAARFAFARDVVKGRIASVNTDIAAIDAEIAKMAKNDASIVDKAGTRNDFMKSLNRRLDTTVTNFNAFRGDPQLKQIRVELDERAGKTSFLDTQGKPYSCPDQGLATMIRSVVASIDALPSLERPKIATVEGSDATVEAFRRLTATFIGALSFKLPPSADEMRDLQKRAVASADASPDKRAAVSAISAEQAGLSKRDYIPLSIAVFVDLCLLLVSMGKPANRLGNLVPKMREAERGPVIQILSRFNEIHKDRQIRENFEIFRHVVFDLNGDYYVAVPLDAPPRMNPKDREDLRLEAQLLGNLFTSFEKEKIFSRVLMPYITTSQIQKKLWKQGSKFSHAESFRLYKFKDGAWSEIILGAIMGAAKRVETDKRRRRVEDEVFARHEPRFTGAVSDMATGAATGQPAPSYQQPNVSPQYQPAPHVPRPAPPHQPMPRPVRGNGAGVADAAMPASAFGPYAAAAQAEVELWPQPTHHGAPNNVAPYPGPLPRRPVEPHSMATDEVVADLQAHRQRVEAQSEVSLRPAVPNANTGNADVSTPDVIALPPLPPEPLRPAPMETMRVEATERTVTFHVPTSQVTGGEAAMPASLRSMIAAATRPAATDVTEQPLQIEQADDAFQPWSALPHDDKLNEIAGRFAPTTNRT